MRVIVSGGGTAGHIYPALAVAEVLRSKGVEVLFVGALGKMEMERVPKAGFDIVGLPVVGIQRSFSCTSIINNLKFPFKLLSASCRARRVIKQFAPDVVVGFGGYASAPIVRAAQGAGVPTVLQEQNSYAGLANRMLSKRARAICVAYGGMERFFANANIVLTGNPLRGNIKELPSRAESAAHFGFEPNTPTILVTGGSLGTRTLNEMVFEFLRLASGGGEKLQIIWQTGKFYLAEYERRLKDITVLQSVRVVVVPFVERMDMAYGASDVVVCRSGASTISELQLIGKPAVFIPSPNVAEDHQSANARAVVEGGGAVMVKDSHALSDGMRVAIELLSSGDRLSAMSAKLKVMGRPNASDDVAQIVMSSASGGGSTMGDMADEGDMADKQELNTQDINTKDDAVQDPNTQEPNTQESKPKAGSIYFVGIGGIGMSALARFFRHEGYTIGGYDRVRTPLTAALENEGMAIHYDDDVGLIGEAFKDKATTRVIYTPAIPHEHGELNWFRDNGFEVVKRSQALGLLCKDKYTMAVAGTHGKSSTSTLVAWLNHCASRDGSGSALVGAISKNFKSNIVMGSGDRMAVEADEFDRSFHQLHPAVALITSADPDHLDIYGTAEEFTKAFEKFASQCSDTVIVKLGVELATPPSLKRFSYALEDKLADYHTQNLTLLDGGFYGFDIVTPSKIVKDCRLGIPGKINVENAVGAVALLDQRGFEDEALRGGLASFEGIERRFDLWVNEPSGVYLDDYAHHPEELRGMLDSVRSMFGNRHITICFQPHLYSRTNDFHEGFARSLSLADRVVLIPIYPARELPMEGVSSEMIYELITTQKFIVPKSEMVAKLAELPTDIVITAGAGDIDMLRREVSEVVKAKIEQNIE